MHQLWRCRSPGCWSAQDEGVEIYKSATYCRGSWARFIAMNNEWVDIAHWAYNHGDLVKFRKVKFVLEHQYKYKQIQTKLNIPWRRETQPETSPPSLTTLLAPAPPTVTHLRQAGSWIHKHDSIVRCLTVDLNFVFAESISRKSSSFQMIHCVPAMSSSESL